MKNTTNTNKYFITAVVAVFVMALILIMPVAVFADSTYSDPSYNTSPDPSYTTYSDPSYNTSPDPSYTTYSDPSYSVISSGFSGGSYYNVAPGYYNYNSTVTTGGFSGGTLNIVPIATYNNNSTVTSGTYYVPGNTTVYANPNSYLDGTCSGTVTTSGVGGIVVWTANATGGNGYFNYYWSGDNFLSGSGQSVTETYTTAGIKNATVTINSNGQSITRTCSVNVGTGNQVLAYSSANPNLSSVYLSDVPYTGAGDVARVTAFVLGLIVWSMALAYYLLKRKEGETAVLTSVVSANNFSGNEHLTEKGFVQQVTSDNKDIESVVEYARSYKVILSSDAAARLVKVSRLNKKNISTFIQQIASDEWTAIGEKDLEKYL